MTFLAATPQSSRQAAQSIALTPSDPEGLQPAWWEGSLDATGVALGRVLGVGSRIAGEAEYQAAGILTRPIDYLFGSDITGYLDDELRRKTAEATAAMVPDPYTTGTLGQVLYGIVGVGVPALVGGYVGGPAGAAIGAGGFQGVGTYTDLTQQGVDQTTAAQVAVLEGGLTAAGVGAPAAMGRNVLFNTLAFGPVSNVAQSLVASQGTAAILDARGYGELADRYGEVTAESLAADAILGSAFGWAGARGNARMRATPSASDVDVALAALNRKHAEVDTAPGLPADVAALQSHARNLRSATESLLSGEPVRVETEGAFVPRSGVSDSVVLKAMREAGIPEILDDVKALEIELAKRGRAVESEPLPDVGRLQEKRSDAQETARLNELRQEWKAGRLSPEGMHELQTLETRDRLSAKVAGRRIPGVQNMDAFREAESAGRLAPVAGFADADNFKAVNDTLGHNVGDQAISMLGRTFAEELGPGKVYHRGGDEFILQADTPEELHAAMQRARARLEQAELVATRADGTTVSRKGLRFSYGEGKTAEEAESAQYRDKQARKDAGLRTDRNQPPADAVASREGLGEQRGADRQPPAEDPAEAVTREIVAETPDMPVVDENGREVPASEMMAEADAIVRRAEADGPGFSAAVNCFLRNGG